MVASGQQGVVLESVGPPVRVIVVDLEEVVVFDLLPLA